LSSWKSNASPNRTAATIAAMMPTSPRRSRHDVGNSWYPSGVHDEHVVVR
jgi:hypothetical protein